MTDVAPRQDDRAAVSRVLAALSADDADRRAEREVLSTAFDPERSNLGDLPEIALWMVLKEGGGFDTTTGSAPLAGAEIDLTGPTPSVRPARGRVIDVTWEVRRPAAPPDDGPAEPRGRAPGRIRRRPWRREREVPVARVWSHQPLGAPGVDPAPAPPTEPARMLPFARTQAPAVEPVAAPPVETPVESVEPVAARAVEPVDARPVESTPAPPVDTIPTDDTADDLDFLAALAALDDTIRDRLAEPPHLRIRFDVVGTAIPDPHLDRRTTLTVRALDDWLRQRLAEPIRVDLGDPAAEGTAVPDSWWPPRLVTQLAELDAALRRTLRPAPARRPAVRDRSASAGTARPDAFWPRHLVRAGRTPRPLPPAPREADELEHLLRSRLDGVALVGEADVLDVDAEIEIALWHLVRDEPIDRIGRTHPALLTTHLVAQADADLAGAVSWPLRGLQPTGPVGLAFSEALVRLGKPVFRELEQREHVDPRLRFVRRMELHAGLSPTVTASVIDAVLDAYWSGAATGRQVAAHLLAGGRATGAAVGEPALRLLTRTDHGAAVLSALLELVVNSFDPVASPVHHDPLPPAVISAARARLAQLTEPHRSWGDSSQPTVSIGDGPGDAPMVSLPATTARWHLNRELLGYGSPNLRRTVALPSTRSGKWAITTGNGRGDGHGDVTLRSAARDRTVLVFDEGGRYHHPVLPLGGSSATVVAPSGSRVSGEVERTLMVGRWIGFERIHVDLRDLDELTISARRAQAVAIPIDRRLGAVVRTALGGRRLEVRFAGHRPPPGEIEIAVSDGLRHHSVRADGPEVRDHRATFVVELDERWGPTVHVTVSRRGFEPCSADIDLPMPDEAVAASFHDSRPKVEPPTPTSAVAPTTAPTAAPTTEPTSGPPVAAVVAALAGRGSGAWRDAMEQAAGLDEWERTRGRAIRQWAITHGPIANLDPLRRVAGRAPSASRTLVVVLDACVLAATGARHGHLAARYADEAAELAPDLVAACRDFAATYAAHQAAHPASRFVPISVTGRRP